MWAVPTILGSDLSSHGLLKGALAGFLAIAALSLSMVLGWVLLPRREKHHLPPRLITEEIAERVGLGNRLNQKELARRTIFYHFGYGTIFGGIYTSIEHVIPLPAMRILTQDLRKCCEN